MIFLTALITAAVAVEPVQAEFPNSSQTKGTLLEHTGQEMGRLAVIDILGDYVITIPEAPSSPAGSDFLVRAWDISNPSNPFVVDTFGRTEHPFNAHGSIKRGNEIYIGGYPDDAIRLESDGTLSHVPWSGPEGHWNKSGMMRPWAARFYWSYGQSSGEAWLELDGEVTAEWDHLGMTGVVGFPTFMGNLMIYAGDQNGSGIATYDVSDPSDPRLLDVFNVAKTHPYIKDVAWDGVESDVEWGIGGYWAEIYGHYMVFVRRNENPGIQIVDFSDPSNMRLHCDFLVKDPAFGIDPDDGDWGDPMYLGFQDEFVFSERYKLNIETCEADLIINEVDNGVDTGQYARPIGNLWLTGGYANWRIKSGNPAGLGIWAHQAEPDNRPPYVAYHIPRVDETGYPVMAPISLMIPETLRSETIIPGDTLTVTEVGGSEVAIDYVLSHTGMLTVDPIQYLKANTTYEVRLSGIEDAVHNPMETYIYRFSTGAALDSDGYVPPPVDNPAPPTPEPDPSNTAPDIVSVGSNPSSGILVGTSVNFSVNATDADGDSLEYRYRFEGESSYGDWIAASSISYTFDESGNQSLSVQVRDPDGATDTTVKNISVLSELNENDQLAQLSSGPLSYSPQAQTVWVVNPDNDSISRISSGAESLEHEVQGVGNDPRGIAVDGNGNIWVTVFGEDLIQIFDPTGSLIETVDLLYGDQPYGIVMNASGSTAYVSLYGSGSVIKFDVANPTSYDLLDLPSSVESDMHATPRALALSRDESRLLVTRFISDQNWGEIYDIDPSSMVLNRTIRLDKSLVPDDNSDGSGTPNYLSSVLISDDGRWAYVVGTKVNTDKGLLNDGDDIDDDNTVRTFLATIDLQSGAELVSQRFDFDNADSPSSLAMPPNGWRLFVGMQGRNQVWAISRNPNTGLIGEVEAQFDTGLAPQGVYLDAGAGYLYSKNLTDRTVSAIDISNFLSSGAIDPDTNHVASVSLDKMSDEVLLGKQLFYNAAHGVLGEEQTGIISAEGYISCATCHIDGGQDGRVYDFSGRGEGLRNNISLKGREGVKFGPVHWSANFDEIQDFENDIRLRFLGRGFLTNDEFETAGDPMGQPKAGLDEELDALAAYVTSLGRESLPRSTYRNRAGGLTESAVRGQLVFEELGCADCHVGKAYTDAQAHDVGTMREYSGTGFGISALKTPSLLGLYESAPYMHDGSAQSLADVFSIVGGMVVQAEDSALFGGAFRVESSDISVNYFRAGAAVRLGNSGGIEFDVDGGSEGGEGIIRVRYGSSSGATDLQLQINDSSTYVQSLKSLPQVRSQDVSFAEAIFAVRLSSGSNAVSLTTAESDPNVVIDDVTISTPEDVANASSHTIARDLTDTSRDHLISYLRELDQESAAEGADDPFEPIFSPANADGWVYCAEEGEYCDFEGDTLVRYGAEGQYEVANFVEGADCSPSTFGGSDILDAVCEFSVFSVEEAPVVVADGNDSPQQDDPVDPIGGDFMSSDSSGGSGSISPFMSILASVLILLYRRKRLTEYRNTDRGC